MFTSCTCVNIYCLGFWLNVHKLKQQWKIKGILTLKSLTVGFDLPFFSIFDGVCCVFFLQHDLIFVSSQLEWNFWATNNGIDNRGKGIDHGYGYSKHKRTYRMSIKLMTMLMYITNFPPMLESQDLMKMCEQHGTVRMFI